MLETGRRRPGLGSEPMRREVFVRSSQANGANASHCTGSKVARYGVVRYVKASNGPTMMGFGLIMVVVGLVTDGIAVAAVGVVLLLTGLYARSREV